MIILTSTLIKSRLKLLKSLQQRVLFLYNNHNGLFCNYSTIKKPDDVVEELYSYWKTEAPKKFNFSKDIFDRHAANRPNATALWFDNDLNEEQKWSFISLKEESIRSAIFLRSLLGLPNSKEHLSPQQSPYIITILPRIPQWWFLHLAAIRIGSVFSPATTMLSSLDIQYRLEASRAKLIITDEANMAKVNDAQERSSSASDFKKIIVRNAKTSKNPVGNDWIDFNEGIKNISEDQIKGFLNTDTNSQDFAQGYFTSGTTGKPKMVAHSHASYGIGHCVTARMLQLKEDDVMWNISDPGWAKSSYSNFFAPWTVGSTVYIHQMERFEASKVLKALRDHPITNLCAPPTLYKSMLQEDNSAFKFKSLRFAVGAGEPVNPAVSQKWKEKTDIKLHQLYGQTEMVCVDCQESVKEASLGVPDGYLNMKIVDSNAKECAPGEEGEIALKIKPVRPIGLFTGYLKLGSNGPEMDKEKNASCFIGDYYLTGDTGYKDESGHLFFVGRGDDVIGSSGYRIGPTEIESVLQTHPSVVENAAVGSPHEERGEVVKAFIVLAESYDMKSLEEKEKLKKELQDYVKSKTAPYKYPRRIEFVKTLPKTVSGKILRRELKRMEYEKYKK